MLLMTPYGNVFETFCTLFCRQKTAPKRSPSKIGGIHDASNKASTPIEVDRFVKTTGVCPVCGAVVELKLSDREFTCPLCGSWFDRDVASALVIKDKGLCLWNAGET
ncbi:MAG: zinc ribbon domain-containing protein, partial [Nitrososphaeria archaeon]